MGKALDTVSFTVTAPGAVGTAMTAFTGDPASVRNGAPGSLIRMIAAFSKAQAVGFSQVVFPSGNDTTRNIRWSNVVNQPGNMFPRGVGQPLEPQEALSLTQAGSAVVGDVEMVSLMMLYDDLPGSSSRLIDMAELQARGVRSVTVQDTITPTAASSYSGARAINAGSDLLRANTDYAIVGAKIGITCQALTVRGPDTANLRCCIPGLINVDESTINWFAGLSEYLGTPTIPCFNSANKSGTFVEVAQDENLTAVPFALLLVELSPS